MLELGTLNTVLSFLMKISKCKFDYLLKKFMLTTICVQEKKFSSINFTTKKVVEVFSTVYRFKLVFSNPQKYLSQSGDNFCKNIYLCSNKKVKPNSFNGPEN